MRIDNGLRFALAHTRARNASTNASSFTRKADNCGMPAAPHRDLPLPAPHRPGNPAAKDNCAAAPWRPAEAGRGAGRRPPALDGPCREPLARKDTPEVAQPYLILRAPGSDFLTGPVLGKGKTSLI